MTGAIGIVIVLLAGWCIVGVIWERSQQRARDLDEIEHHRSLMRELRQYDERTP